MKKSDFEIGREFWTNAGRWRCTDVGSRVVTAIKLDRTDASWYNGPPYAVVERVLDEYDQQACYATEAEYRSAIAPRWWPNAITTDRGYWIGRARLEFLEALLAEPDRALFDERCRKLGEPAPDRATIEYHRDRICGLVVNYEARCRKDGRDIERPARHNLHQRNGR